MWGRGEGEGGKREDCRDTTRVGVWGGGGGTKKDNDGAEADKGKGRAEDQLAGKESEDKGGSA